VFSQSELKRVSPAGALQTMLTYLMHSLLQLAATITVLLAARVIFRYTTPFTAKCDLVEEQNPAVGVL
jgi:hypothetical protein